MTAAAEVRLVESDRLATALPGAEVLFVYDFRSSALRETWSAADSLRWVQIASTGVDPVLFDEFVASDVVLTNSRGIFERPIAEYVLAQILAFAKDIRRSTRAQAALSWRHFESESIEGTPVGVLGTGPIGQAISTLLGAVGMRVTVLGRAESADLSSHVGEFEYLVLAAPLTPQTRGIVNARVLSAMRPTARLINVGRGELVGTWDLVSALNRGGIAGAALDVTDPEPLPVGHPLWRTPNTHITPHNSGDVRGWSDRLQDQFVVNFERYLRGEELLNIVDKNRMHRHA
ncbi:D-isomer specific 2-hydroxyacid dehydrogenase, catalytic domain protein [Mycobacteroides abscessus 1948]|uniref:D-isomer specific 2-hydroxyacid dehydrogenase, catalytic domain protein n=1 Tax=Mycobacteroides abscessus 1948 TaxID=1299323 RepID=A0A829QJB6_9MYCO|nr:D-isomer specific 2-hydroxyacid dehydrogenase [Mycobacteroides abscessus 6G-0728-S]EIV08577.1 D-isomer specific 2-hydroxyacid dehydrogenase [Mycobacteroides abscessus 4S-0206]EIV47037.1 D-isomer specific 2-hydroxyacid dehydrogenase [Mycobacteroides abscessus 4S-0116-R]ETZ69304.1 D-isomer specific 2-hydroxyacid dehydrogenase, catalytic domain protein [Mycobacteroides abscessus MAB_110811_1470]EUA63154.1 D-isomer specific 2-hydroxyacid dehydrogenase, catalytic domain protein [Mycobacteroides a